MTIPFIIPIEQVILMQRLIRLGSWRLPLQCKWLDGAKQTSNEPLQDQIHLHQLQTMIKRITRTNITVCNDTISCSPCIKLLGSYLDQSLTMSIHITKKCSLAMWNLSRIRSIKNCLDIDSLKTTVQAYVSCILT